MTDLAVFQPTTFPETEIRRRLGPELQSIADDGELLRPDWEPLLDSKRIVGTVILLEDLFDFKIPPDKVIRRGGYDSVRETINDMVSRLKGLHQAHQLKQADRISA